MLRHNEKKREGRKETRTDLSTQSNSSPSQDLYSLPRKIKCPVRGSVPLCGLPINLHLILPPPYPSSFGLLLSLRLLTQLKPLLVDLGMEYRERGRPIPTKKIRRQNKKYKKISLCLAFIAIIALLQFQVLIVPFILMILCSLQQFCHQLSYGPLFLSYSLPSI